MVRTRRWLVVVAVPVVAGLLPGPAVGAGVPAAPGAHAGLWRGGRAVALRDAPDAPIPSFSRQTRLPCTACHTTFPQLTAFGRLFKLNGYTLTGIEQIRSQLDTSQAPVLALDLIPPVSVMAEAAVSHVSEAPAGTQNDQVDFPQQLSLFIGEAITPKLGTFLQFTYTAADGALGWDNADIRFANHTTFASQPLIFGITLNNNPTVQDVWNTVPAWGFPFASSSVVPTPAAATMVDGGLGQRVAGLGAYGFWNNLLYAELSVYRSAPQGGPHPADSTSTSTIRGVAPYWRVALNRQSGAQSFEVGTYGMQVKQYPEGVAGPTDRFRDIAFDAQYQVESGPTLVALHGTWIGESQTLDATAGAGGADNVVDHLRTLRADGSLFWPQRRLGATLGFFTTSGDADAGLYPAAAVSGSGTGSPNSTGLIGQFDFNPWLNTRFSAQYVWYGKFNGASTNYDGSGRNASANNTLYLVAWLVF